MAITQPEPIPQKEPGATHVRLTVAPVTYPRVTKAGIPGLIKAVLDYPARAGYTSADFVPIWEAFVIHRFGSALMAYATHIDPVDTTNEAAKELAHAQTDLLGAFEQSLLSLDASPDELLGSQMTAIKEGFIASESASRNPRLLIKDWLHKFGFPIKTLLSLPLAHFLAPLMMPFLGSDILSEFIGTVAVAVALAAIVTAIASVAVAALGDLASNASGNDSQKKWASVVWLLLTVGAVAIIVWAALGAETHVVREFSKMDANGMATRKAMEIAMAYRFTLLTTASVTAMSFALAQQVRHSADESRKILDEWKDAVKKADAELSRVRKSEHALKAAKEVVAENAREKAEKEATATAMWRMLHLAIVAFQRGASGARIQEHALGSYLLLDKVPTAANTAPAPVCPSPSWWQRAFGWGKGGAL